jgi:hypothetical protein
MPRLLGGGEARLYSYRIGDPSRPSASRIWASIWLARPAGRLCRAGGLRPAVQHRRAGLCGSHRCVRPVVPLRASEPTACRATSRVWRAGGPSACSMVSACRTLLQPSPHAVGRACRLRASMQAAMRPADPAVESCCGAFVTVGRSDVPLQLSLI